jgi:asparagine synthetase B (glutamine-hydrolysing)
MPRVSAEALHAGEGLSWIDRDGVLAAWGQRNDPTATIVAGVRRVVSEMVGARAVTGDWVRAFEAAVARIARRARAPVVALGGGLDGAAVLAAWRASGVAMPTVVTAATGLDGYDEIDDALAIAALYGCRCQPIDVTPDAIVRAIPEAAAIGETPLYNLHPVTRLVLAREAFARGHDVLVTGDGGDAVFAGVPDHDYVPIVAAYTRAWLAHASPYSDDAVIAATPIDPMRRVLRDYVGDDRPKRPRRMPDLAVDPVADRDRIEQLARVIDRPPAIDVRWVTLDHTVRELER